MISVNCVRCGTELEQLGGILFSPPSKNEYEYEETVNKYHLCKRCFEVILFQIVLKKKEDKK